MATVDIRNVEKRFGGLKVIHGIDLSIADQEFIVLVGPSGCGKSTLLRMIAGLESISGGEIAIGDKVVNDMLPRDRDIAMVFQNYALYPHMSTYENMGFSLRLRKRPKSEIDQKIRTASEILNLDPYLDRSPSQLSGGQRQRVAMGRALVRHAQVFLFDEPLSNLDAKLRVSMRTEIKALHQRIKTTSVYVTHDQIEAMTMADRIVVMNAGRVEQIGAPLDLYDRPGNLFVAGFLGSPSMNFIDGTFHRQGDTAHVECADGTCLPVPAGISGSEGQSVVYGIRPEHLELARNGAGSMTADVEVVEPTGPHIEVFVQLAGARICAIFSERHPFRPGERISLNCNPERISLFDKQSGQRID